MGHVRLESNAAFQMAAKLVAIIAPCLREEERKDCFDEFYRVVRDGLRDFSEQKDQMEKRLNPDVRRSK